MATKDFAPIESDYAFFMAHATEAENDIAQYARQLVGWPAEFLTGGRPSIRLLDFGCGTGEFSEGLLSESNWPPELLHVTLVEPVTHQRLLAARRLQKFSAHPVHPLDQLPTSLEPLFDLALSNHVLYYVDDLDLTLKGICQLLVPGGRLLLAIAGWDNPLLQLWKFGFGLLGLPVPYYAAEDVETVLIRQGLICRQSKVPYRLRFDDTTENRLKVLRFLFGEYLARITSERLLSWFDTFASGECIEIGAESEHFAVEITDRRG